MKHDFTNPPAPDRVAAICLHEAWEESTPDKPRLALEWAYRTIRRLTAHTVRQAKRIELYEAMLEARK